MKHGTDIYSNTWVFSKEWSILGIIKCNSLNVTIERALQTTSANSHIYSRGNQNHDLKNRVMYNKQPPLLILFGLNKCLFIYNKT